VIAHLINIISPPGVHQLPLTYPSLLHIKDKTSTLQLCNANAACTYWHGEW